MIRGILQLFNSNENVTWQFTRFARGTCGGEPWNARGSHADQMIKYQNRDEEIRLKFPFWETWEYSCCFRSATINLELRRVRARGATLKVGGGGGE